MRAFFLCAGKGTRWQCGTPKQLAQVGDEAILHRSIRQFESLGAESWVVTSNPEISATVSRTLSPESCGFLSESCASALQLCCEERNILALGDVYFSDEMVHDIVESDGIRVFGRRGYSKFSGFGPEIFAIAFDYDDVDKVRRALLDATRDAESIPRGVDLPDPGGLWQVYRSLVGFGLYDCRFDTKIWSEQAEGDITDDLDDLDRYRVFTERLRGL